jgi:hypothetical protein
MLMLLAAICGCYSWFPGPRYPTPSPPLIDEPTKPLDIGCDAVEAGTQ